jgi:hypothetical protein
MAKKILKNILFIVLLANVHAHAQQVSKAVADVIKANLYFPTVQNNERNFVIINSNKSNRTDKKISVKEFNDIANNLQSINLYRQILSDKIEEKDFDKVNSNVLGKVTNDKIKKLLTKEEITEMWQYLKLKSEDELVDFINTHPSPMDYKLLYTSFKVKQLLGYVVEDKNIQKGMSYLYKITFEDKNGNEKTMGYSVGLNAQQNNVVLNKIKPTISHVSMSDSLVIGFWHYPLNTPDFKNFMATSEKLNQNVGIFEGIKAFTLNRLQAELWIKSENKFMPTVKKNVSLNETGDTLEVSFAVRTLPEDVVNAYIVLNDDINNISPNSDTSQILSVDPLQVPMIRNITVADITDGLQVAWDKLPEKPYFKGIEITRSGEKSVLDTLAILTPSDTAYSDFKVKVGIHYIYNVKALYKEGYGMEQKIYAQGVGTNTKFSKPSKVNNLTAANEGKDIKLSWDYTKNSKFYGYYVYRGLSPLDMLQIAGPVTDNFYVDATDELSGVAEYSYYVVVKDLMQQNSEPSNIVAIKPQRKVVSLVPYNLKSETVNDMLYLEWVDVKLDDDFIKGYTIRRAEVGKKEFKTIDKGLIEGAFYVDSTSTTQSSYQYQVASINLNNDTSDYSDIYTYVPYKEPVAVLSDYTIRNLSDGIEISWPSILYPNRKKYNIYKSEIQSNTLQKIGSANATEQYFVDKNVEKGKEYIYTISITDIENREGEQAQVQTIIRD